MNFWEKSVGHTIFIFGLGLIYACFFILFTFPLVKNFKTSIISDGGDGLAYAWGVYDAAANIHQNGNPFYTQKIFYPTGANTFWQTDGNIYRLATFLGNNPFTIINLIVFFDFIFSGIGAYLLARYFIKNKYLAALVGFCYAFTPYKTTRLLGHYNLVLTSAIPFFIFFWLRSFTFDETLQKIKLTNKKSLVAAFLFWLLALLCSFYYAFFLLVLIFTYLIFFKFKIYNFKFKINKKLIWIFLLSLVDSTFLALSLHYIFKISSGFTQISTDLLGIIIPSPQHLLIGNLLPQLPFNPFLELRVYVGLTLLILFILYFCKKYFKEASISLKLVFFWLFVCLFLALPVIKIGGVIITATPSVLVYFTPLIRQFRGPTRYFALISLFIPLISVLALQKISAKSKYKKGLILILSLLIIFEFWIVPLPEQKTEEVVPKIYYLLAKKPAGTLLEIPFGIKDGYIMQGSFYSKQLLAQTVHNKNLIGGYVGRLSQAQTDFVKNNKVLSALLKLQKDKNIKNTLAPEEIEKFQKDLAIKYILLFPDKPNGAAESFIRKNFSKKITDEVKMEGYTLFTLN